MEDIVKDSTGKYTPKPLQSITTLPKETQDTLIQNWVSSGLLPRAWNMDQVDRIYKNKQFKDKFTPEVYAQVTDKSSPLYMSPEQRDEYYDNQEYSAAIESKFANDPNLQYYLNSTTEGLKDFWESGIMSPEELKEAEQALDKGRRSNEENRFTPKNPVVAALLAPTPENSTDVSFKDVSKAVAYSRGLLEGEEKERYERIINERGQEALDLLQGTIHTGVEDEEVDRLVDNLYSSNLKRIEDFRIREDNRVLNLPGVQDAVKAKEATWHQEVADGKLSYEDIEKTYRDIFDNDVRGDGAGSRYYTGYKNRSELSDFGVDDMIEKLAQYSVLSDAYGNPAKAMETVDSGIFTDVRSNQNFWRRRWHVLTGVGAKANAMAMNELFGGYVDLYHAFKDTPEEYQKFKTAEDVLTAGGAGFLFNPNYWNYVDQYGVWNPYEIQRLNQNGGIGGRTNVYSPNGKMTAEQFIDESFKMLGYMLPSVVISAATKNVPRNSAWAYLLSGAELLGSAASLGSAYSSGTYSKITLGADQAIDKMFDDESYDFLNNYYAQNPDYVEKFIKAKGLTENDSELLLIPAKEEAERALYNDAKEAYFQAHPERVKVYDEAYKQKLYDAQKGALVNNLIETARMAVSGAFWGKWTKSKLTRDLANRGYNPVRVVGRQAEQVLSKNAARLRAARMTALSGGVDNWLDDITAGIGAGLGLGDFNNYLGSLYGPYSYIEGAKFTGDILDGMIWGMEGAREAFYDPQTWIDGAIGATGTLFGTRVNGITIIRDAIKKDGQWSGDGFFSKGQKTINGKAATGLQVLDRYITNGIITSAADADAVYARTQDYVDQLNEEILPKYDKDINIIGNFISDNVNFNTLADSILEGKDLKQIGMLKSSINMIEALGDPTLSQLPEIQKFSDFLNRGRRGNFTYEELQSFINDQSNIEIKNALDSKGNSISEDLAREALQKNVNNFLKIFDNYRKISKGIDKNGDFSFLPSEVKTQLAVQLALNGIWEERLNSMQEALGTPRTERARWDYEAEFGSAKGREGVLNALRAIVVSDKMKLATQQAALSDVYEQYKKATTEEEREKLGKEVEERRYSVEALQKKIKENQNLIETKSKASVTFDESGNARTLSKEEIMHLSPEQRAKMLDPENAVNYSTEQRAVIQELTEELRNHIDENGNTQDLYQVALDAGTMYERLQGSQKSIREAIKSPYMLKNYADRLKERKAYMLVQATIQRTREEQLAKLETVTSPQEAVDVIFRGKHPAKTIDKGFYIPADVVDEYIEKHPEAKEIMSEARDMVKTLDDFFASAEKILGNTASVPIKRSIAAVTRDANTQAEVISAIEGLMDEQSDPTAKLQYDRILEFMKSLGYQRDATKVRDRELERQKKQEAELKRIEEEKKKDGKNYGWDGYKVGDTVYNKETGNSGVVVGFEKTQSGENKMLIQVKYSDNVVGTIRYDSVTGKDKITKEQPKPAQTAPEGAQQVFDDTTTGNPSEASEYELASVEDVEISVDAEGAVESPSVEKQAAAAQSPVIEVPESDPTDQGNNIVEDSPTTISGNRWVTYSIDALKDGVVREEVPENPNSVFGKFVEWLHNNKIKLQEIIDEEFGRIITDNPDIDIRFMKMKTDSDIGYKLQNVLFNVVELTPALRKKYHDESRGGVIQANGKSWLVVGTTGFEVGNTAQMKAFDVMKAPINKRRDAYFNANPTEVYYVDDVAYSRVQNTTSGRIVNQRLGAESPTLKKVSELLKAAGIPLNKASFGVQTKQANDKKGFATTKNAGDKSRIFNPRNAEDNRGRTFVLIDTANGNKIPGMIEPAMYNSIAEGTPLKEMINETLARLFSTSYETRSKAIKELCSFLVLGDEKNILIGTKDSAVITIKQQGMPDITQKLGANFDSAKFFRDLENANFQINVTLNTLENPVMLKLYDDSGALMTSVDSMRTAGMSYSIYMTDTSGKPIVLTPVGNAVPGTGTSEFKTYKSVRVNNTTYEFKNGQWENRNDRSKVEPGSELEISCVYNQAIKENGRAPMITQDGKEYYDFMGTDGKVFLASRDGLGNVRLLSQEASQTIINEIQNRIEQHKRMENLEDGVLDETPTPTPTPTVETITQDQINQQAVGNFETPKPEIKPQKQSEVVKEAKESQSQQRKEVITDIGKKSLAELQNTENLSNFVEVFNSDKYNDALYDILESKGWGDITGTLLDADVLEKHGIPTTGITNVESWLDLIRNCR